MKRVFQKRGHQLEPKGFQTPKLIAMQVVQDASQTFLFLCEQQKADLHACTKDSTIKHGLVLTLITCWTTLATGCSENCIFHDRNYPECFSIPLYIKKKGGEMQF